MSTIPSDLPAALTSFIGREREMREISALLNDSHLVTFTGPGGTGKTRLSLQVAAEGDLAPARKFWEESAALRRDIGDPSLLAYSLRRLAEIALQQKDLPPLK